MPPPPAPPTAGANHRPRPCRTRPGRREASPNAHLGMPGTSPSRQVPPLLRGAARYRPSFTFPSAAATATSRPLPRTSSPKRHRQPPPSSLCHAHAQPSPPGPPLTVPPPGCLQRADVTGARGRRCRERRGEAEARGRGIRLAVALGQWAGGRQWRLAGAGRVAGGGESGSGAGPGGSVSISVTSCRLFPAGGLLAFLDLVFIIVFTTSKSLLAPAARGGERVCSARRPGPAERLCLPLPR